MSLQLSRLDSVQEMSLSAEDLESQLVGGIKFESLFQLFPSREYPENIRQLAALHVSVLFIHL